MNKQRRGHQLKNIQIVPFKNFFNSSLTFIFTLYLYIIVELRSKLTDTLYKTIQAVDISNMVQLESSPIFFLAMKMRSPYFSNAE